MGTDEAGEASPSARPIFSPSNAPNEYGMEKEDGPREQGAQLEEDEEEQEDCPAEDEVLHVKIQEVPNKSMRKERKSLKYFEGVVLEKSPMVCDLAAVTHKEIVTHLLDLIWADGEETVDKETALSSIITKKREDGTEVWYEMIGGRGFIVVLGEVPGMSKNRIALAKLKKHLNLSVGEAEHGLVGYVALAVGPPASQASMPTRTVFETGRSAASILSEPAFRVAADKVHTEQQLRTTLHEYLQTEFPEPTAPAKPEEHLPWCVTPFSGLVENVRRRARWWVSDFTEAMDYKAKVLSTAVYLFCVILAPAIAFGDLMSTKTKGEIGPMEILISQSISGFLFSLVGGCPFVIIMTTGPLTVFIGFLYELSDSMGVKFLPFYAWVGVWNTFWLLLSVAFNLSNQMHYVTSFVDEVFGSLVAGIFILEAVEPVGKHFFTPESSHDAGGAMGVILALGTFIAAVQLMDLRASQLFSQGFREVISDYGTALAVLLLAGIYHLANIDGEYKVDTLEVPDFVELSDSNRSIIVEMSDIPTYAVFVAAGPAFLLFTLFFLDENITSILSNKKEFKLRKGSAMHLDLFVVAIINLFLGICGLPFLHGALPQSPLHVLQLAEHEEYVEQGAVVKRVVKSRETRMTGLLCHILIAAATIGALPALKQLPVPVLHGVFLTMAYQGLKDNPFILRILLWFKELSQYPPTHLVRKLRVSTIHKWTVVQLVGFGVLWGVKSSPAALGFPFVLVLMVLFRQFILPKFFTEHDMHVLEGSH